MSDSAQPSTLTLDDTIQDLPEDNTAEHSPDTTPSPALANLFSLNAEFPTIELVKNKTILGRNSETCTPGALLRGNTISGTHCQITSRSMQDVDAPIWITDLSTNGVWVNEKRIEKNTPTKILNKDIISFSSSMNVGQDGPAFMLIDKRQKSAFKDEQQEKAKRVANELGIDTAAQEDEPARKKAKAESSNTEAENKDKEDSAFEKEFECGICHEIMHKALVLQPCLHSFCRECCKGWLKNSTVCPSCRQGVNKTKRDFKLNNLIALFLKNRPNMARDDMEDDDGAASDTSNVVSNPHDVEDDDEDEGAYDSDDDVGYGARFPPGHVARPTICPCCDTHNTTGYVCPPTTRLEPLPPGHTYAQYMSRRQNYYPGHTRCRHCYDILPIVPLPGNEAVADRFRCKMCFIPSCGCQTKSLDDRISQNVLIAGFLNQAEERIINDYLLTENLTPATVWQEIKDGMETGTFHYLGTTTTPAVGQTGQAGPVTPTPSATQNGASTDGNTDTATAPIPPPTTAPAAAAPPPNPGVARGMNVTCTDKLCTACGRDYFSNGPLYQWRKNLDPAKLPARVTSRESCWWGRECRTQHNRANLSHAERLNHICEKKAPRRD